MADLHFTDDEPDDVERAAVDAVIAPVGPALDVESEHLVRGGTQRRHERRHLLLPVLHALNNKKGWISPGGLNHACRQLQVPPAEAYGVATFYDLFRIEAPDHDGPTTHVCVDPACRIAGADQLLAEVEAAGGHAHRSPCLGQCERAPAVFVQGVGAPDHVPADDTAPIGAPEVEGGREERTGVGSGGDLNDTRARDIGPSGDVHDPPASGLAPGGDVGDARATGPARAGEVTGARSSGAATAAGSGAPSAPRVLARVGLVDPTSLDSYRAYSGYEALDRAIELGPDAVIDMLDQAGLSGRGGAAFPTGRKWRAVRDAPGATKHVVANADESEPGTFKDRILMETDPFALVESLTIAGLAVGAEHGWIYVRGEYPRATERLLAAIDQARAAGLLGSDVAGSGASFDIEVRRGAGAYICGEETALFNSIEGFRGEPRNKPPYPTTHGLFGEPTAINNVETLLNVPLILLRGVDLYRADGTADSPGTRLFCLSGHVARPGLYEAPFGVPLGDLLDRAGGVTGELQAVLLGGAAGSFVGPDALDLPLSREATQAVGASLGSGVVMAFDTKVDLTDIVTRLAEFFRDESCGQCVPCRVGTVRQHEILVSVGTNGGSISDHQRTLIEDIAGAMGDASICGLGHTAASAVRSALALGLIGAPR